MSDQPTADASNDAAKQAAGSIMAGQWFGHLMQAVDRAAASTYHRAIAIEGDIQKWETENPELGTLAMEALTYVESFAARFGVPVGAIQVIGLDIMTAWKALAALDNSVQTPPPIPVPQEPST